MLDRLIDQLDTLIPFLGLAHEEIFNVIHNDVDDWFSAKQRESIPETYNSYKNQIASSAFLLGYSYFEAFISDLAKKILISRPVLLPKDKKITFGDVLESGDYDRLLNSLVEQHVFSIMYGSVETIRDHFKKNLHIDWPERNINYSVIKAGLIRNCLMHNGSIVDVRLSEFSASYQVGTQIILSPSDVHGYGLELRDIAYDIYEQADKKHFGNA